MTVRILKCSQYPSLVDNKYQTKNTIENNYLVEINPAYQCGKVTVTSLNFAANEIEVIDW